MGLILISPKLYHNQSLVENLSGLMFRPNQALTIF